MAQSLASSTAPIYVALLKAIEEEAAKESPPVSVFPFQLEQYEPNRYVVLTGFKGPVFEWESIGYFTFIERYQIHGKTCLWSGGDPASNPGLALKVLNETWELHQNLVVKPIFSNRNEPMLKAELTEHNQVFLMIPDEASYSGGVGNVGGAPGGWAGTIDWSFHFEAHLVPA